MGGWSSAALGPTTLSTQEKSGARTRKVGYGGEEGGEVEDGRYVGHPAGVYK